ncbi:MAG: CinA family protein [Gammaproteobacteria bacterium]
MNTAFQDNLGQLRDRLALSLKARDMRLATAESCSGGWIAKVCTDMPGSSDWFECAIVSYSNASKHRLLGVPIETIEHHGAVSEQTVQAMLNGLFARTAADLGVAVSGIAGPGGGSADKPVGTVWICIGQRATQACARRFTFSGDRNQVREQSLIAAFELLLEHIED